MRRRLVFSALALFGVLGFVTAPSAPATDGAEGSSLATWVDKVGKVVDKNVNPVLRQVPAPDGWHERSVCVGDEGIDRALCLYFPFPI